MKYKYRLGVAQPRLIKYYYQNCLSSAFIILLCSCKENKTLTRGGQSMDHEPNAACQRHLCGSRGI